MAVVPLHNHSEYSAFDGMANVDEIIARIKAIGSDAVGLTDHGVVSGHLEFGRKCVAAGIKPIFGLEAYQARDHRSIVHKMEVINPEKASRRQKRANDAFHLILLAKNNKGLKNLWKLSTLAYLEGYAHGRPRLDLELLEQHRDGLIATSACLGSKVSWELQHDSTKAALELANIFKDDWYIELHTYDTDFQKQMNLELVGLARKQGWPVVYATDAHYACSDEHETHEIFNTMTQRTTLDDPNRISHPPSLWIQGEDDIRKSLSYLNKSTVDEAINNSVVIASQCDVTLPEPRHRVPVFFPEKPKNYAVDFLINLLEEGYRDKVQEQDVDGIYFNRLSKEIEVIVDADLVNFFLIEWDFCKFADEEGILRGPGRGSVGGSLVAYLLGITDIDPIKYDLIFERFYNKGREKGGMPDIDTDFPAKDRQRIKDYLADRYGEENVGNLGTTMRLHGKSAMDRVGKTLQIPFKDLEDIKAIIDSTTDAGLMAKWEEVIEVSELQPWIEKYPQLFKLVGKFHGRVFTYGIHASGFIISDEPLAESFPFKMLKGEVSTQFDMYDAESLGFLKNDLLGLKNLDILNETIGLIREHYDVDWDVKALHHKRDDYISEQEMWELLDKGLTVGVFQIEDGVAAKTIAKNMKCRSILDLAAVVALNRPGPLRGGYVDAYLKRRNGGEWSHIHPILKNALDSTYGVFVYQEQIIAYMQAIGFNLEEADNVRKIMGKKKPEEMEALHPKYLAAATQHMDEKTAEKVWEGILDFSKYGFNKSHAVGYAIIALWTLWTKWAYPDCFLMACMRVDPDDRDRYVAEALRMGVDVLPPDINKSQAQATLVEGKILFGLTDVKGVANVDWVLENRPFTNYDHMVETLEAQNKEYLKKKKEGAVEGPSPKQRFGAGKHVALFNSGAFDSLDDRGLSDKERREYEKEYLKIILTNDAPRIIEKHRLLIEEECTPLSEVEDPGGYFVAGSVVKYEKRKTSTGSTMAWVTIELDGSTLRCALFGDKLYERDLEECTPVVMNIVKTERGVNVKEVVKLR